ncbi:hypothetical protein KY49_16 [Burkholderia sp. MSHR3999]|nr:hypothetical protein KY49_16 [Burkholderia sp. MSHR3999]
MFRAKTAILAVTALTAPGTPHRHPPSETRPRESRDGTNRNAYFQCVGSQADYSPDHGVHLTCRAALDTQSLGRAPVGDCQETGLLSRIGLLIRGAILENLDHPSGARSIFEHVGVPEYFLGARLIHLGCCQMYSDERAINPNEAGSFGIRATIAENGPGRLRRPHTRQFGRAAIELIFTVVERKRIDCKGTRRRGCRRLRLRRSSVISDGMRWRCRMVVAGRERARCAAQHQQERDDFYS